MSLHPLAAQFADVADVYESGRPGYSKGAVGALVAELGIRSGGRVLDLAAGTGKLTRALVDAELDVVAVEPQAPLRDRLAAAIGADRVLEGYAEAIPLPNSSVDAVTVADAFHWFDAEPALAEIRRVLRPGGGLAVLSAHPDWSSASWSHDVGALVNELRPEHPYFDGPPWHAAATAAGGWATPREVHVTAAQPTDPGRLVDYVSSMSFVAALPEDRRRDALERVRDLLEAGETPAEMPITAVIGLTSLV